MRSFKDFTEEERVLIIKETRKDGTYRDIMLCKNKNEKWQFVNTTKGKICPCEFDTRESALMELMTYFPKCLKMVIEEKVRILY